jgi:hypothetical protein
LNPSNSLLRSKLTLGRSFNDGLTGLDIVWSFGCNQSATQKHNNNIKCWFNPFTVKFLLQSWCSHTGCLHSSFIIF